MCWVCYSFTKNVVNLCAWMIPDAVMAGVFGAVSLTTYIMKVGMYCVLTRDVRQVLIYF